MKIVALMIFWDESPSHLAATVASCGRLCDHVAAIDGSFDLMPQGGGSSGSGQHEAIVGAAEAAGVGLTLHVPVEKWRGNEVAKRTFMFEAGRLVARDLEDWFLVIDADEVITQVPGDVRERLARTHCDAATYGLVERFDHGAAANDHFGRIPTREVHAVRGLYRNLPSLRVEGAHYGYTADIDGQPTNLWTGVPALDLTDLRIEHHKARRPRDRSERARAYYTIRDLAGVERAPDLIGAPA